MTTKTTELISYLFSFYGKSNEESDEQITLYCTALNVFDEEIIKTAIDLTIKNSATYSLPPVAHIYRICQQLQNELIAQNNNMSFQSLINEVEKAIEKNELNPSFSTAEFNETIKDAGWKRILQNYNSDKEFIKAVIRLSYNKVQNKPILISAKTEANKNNFEGLKNTFIQLASKLDMNNPNKQIK